MHPEEGVGKHKSDRTVVLADDQGQLRPRRCLEEDERPQLGVQVGLSATDQEGGLRH